MADDRYTAFKQFIALRSNSIRRIARHTQRDYTVQDVETEDWLFAERTDGGTERHRCRSFRSTVPGDPLSYLYHELVRYRERKFCNALRLDQRDSDPPDPYDIANRNESADGIDPLSKLIAAEAAQPVMEAFSPYESEAAAYVYLLGETATCGGWLSVC